MRISNLIRILAEYQMECGDIEIMFGYTDKFTESLTIDPISEMDLETHDLTSRKILLYQPTQVNEEIPFDPAVNDSINDMEEEERAFPSDKE